MKLVRRYAILTESSRFNFKEAWDLAEYIRVRIVRLGYLGLLSLTELAGSWTLELMMVVVWPRCWR